MRGTKQRTRSAPSVCSRAAWSRLYLNPPGQCSGGTAFYRHRETGVDALVLRTQEELRRVSRDVLERLVELGCFTRQVELQRSGACADVAELRDRLFRPPAGRPGPILGSTPEWERTHLLEMRCSRLVAYPGFLLHSGHYEAGASGRRPTSSA